MPRKTSSSKPRAPEAILALSKINLAAMRIRTQFRGEMRKIVTPMAPLFRFSPVASKVYTGMTGTESLVLMRQVMSEIGRELELFEVRRAELESMKTNFPRLALFRKATSLSVTKTGDISAVLDQTKLVKLMSDHAYKLRAAVEKEPSKFIATYGRYTAPPVSLWIEKFVQPAFATIDSLKPGSFGFVVDFSVAGSLNEFLGSFFAAFGKKSSQMSQIKAILGDLGAKYEVTPQGIVQMTKRGARAAPRRVLEDAANRLISKILTPALQELWRETVKDFFLREPTSVSRWFPARPMARKGLRKRESLLGMLLTGRVRFALHTGRDGIVGQFWDFDTNLAPYWPVVQYGYPGKIRAQHGRVLTLKDPDPEWWSKVQWAFGVTRSERKLSSTSETILHEIKVKRSKSLGRYASIQAATAQVPLIMPSGRRFRMLFHPSLLTPGHTLPAYHEVKSGRTYKRKHVTYSLTIQPTPIYRKEVRGQRASMFIERILAMMAERQKILEKAFFDAATAYLFAGEQAWRDIISVFRTAGATRLGG